MTSRPFRSWFFLAALIATCAHPFTTAAASHTLAVTTDHTDAIYQRGETVTFTIKLAENKKPADGAEVSWIISKDGVAPTTNGKVKLNGGQATVTAKLDEPGFLQCRASFPVSAKSNLTASGGAAIDPLQIKPSLPVPDDFDEFWAAQKKKLAAVPINARMTPEKSSAKGVAAFEVQADCIGKPVSGYFARPIGPKPKSLPIILLVHGAGVRSASLGGPISWASKSFLAMDINAHGIPNGKPDKFYSDLSNGELKDYRARGRESRDTVYFQGMFLRLVRAIDFLTSQPEWDGRTIIVHGSSQGGYQSIVAAGLDPRVTFFAGGVPAGCDHTGFKAGRVNGWPHFIGAQENPAANIVEAVRYYDAMNFATRTKAAGILTVGFIDTTCPPSSVYAAYNALTTQKEIFNDPPSGHRVSPEAGAAMNKAILAHAEAMRSGR